MCGSGIHLPFRLIHHAMAALCWSDSIEWLDAANVESDSPSPYLVDSRARAFEEANDGMEPKTSFLFPLPLTGCHPSDRTSTVWDRYVNRFFIVTTFIFVLVRSLPILSFVDDSSSNGSDSLQHSRISRCLCASTILGLNREANPKPSTRMRGECERVVLCQVTSHTSTVSISSDFRLFYTHFVTGTTNYTIGDVSQAFCYRMVGGGRGLVLCAAHRWKPNQSHSPVCIHLHQMTPHVRRVHYSLLKHFPNAAPCMYVCVCGWGCASRLHRRVDVENLECVTSWL